MRFPSRSLPHGGRELVERPASVRCPGPMQLAYRVFCGFYTRIWPRIVNFLPARASGPRGAYRFCAIGQVVTFWYDVISPQPNMPLRFYNTLSQQVEEFHPAD